MSAETPSPADPAAFEANIDLTGGEETPVQAVGRVVGGMLLLIVGGLLALGFLAVYIAGDFIPGMGDIRELGGDWILYLAIFAFVGAVVGFEMVRRGRKARAAEAAESKAIMDKLKTAGVYDGTATTESVQAALGADTVFDEGSETGRLDPKDSGHGPRIT
jgi:hypothetical protein